MTPCILTPCPLSSNRQHRQTASALTLTSISIFMHNMILSNYTTTSGAKGRCVATLICVQKPFALLEDAARWPRHQMSLALHWSHGITHGPVFVIGDWVSCFRGSLLLIFPTPSIKFWFLMCFQTLLLFRPQSISLNNWTEYMVPLCWRSPLVCTVPTLQWKAVVSLTDYAKYSPSATYTSVQFRSNILALTGII